jgi:large subunit ribosomal protein L17
MRHRQSGRKLKRTASHRRATLASLCTALIRHKRITTTVAKAKETRMLVEKMITRARNASAQDTAPASGVHARREVARMIRDREVVKELFTTVAGKVGSRPGGYTRIVRLGQRQGDAAEMAVLELVDFNTGQEKAEKTTAAPKKKSARARRGQPKAGAKKAKPEGAAAEKAPAAAEGASS